MNAWRAAGARRFSSDASRAYRELLNAQRELFGVDKPSRAAAVLEARQQFLANAGVPSVELPGKLQDALDAAAFLRHNVAQTVQNDRGNFGARALSPCCRAASAASSAPALGCTACSPSAPPARRRAEPAARAPEQERQARAASRRLRRRANAVRAPLSRSAESTVCLFVHVNVHRWRLLAP